MFVDMPLMVVDVVAMAVALDEWYRVTLTVRFWLVAAPERASNRFTLKLPEFSASAVCSAGARMKVCDWLLPLMARPAWMPVGRVRDRRCWAPLHRYSCLVPLNATCDGDTGTTGATGAASGPLGLLTVAVLAMFEPGETLATMTSNTTVTEPLAGTLMFDTVTMPLSLSPLGAGENALLEPAGMDTNPPKVTFAGM